MSDYDPLLQRLDAEFAERHEGVRQLLYEKGRPDLVADLDAKMRLIANGVDGAQRTWHSISDAQRRALTHAAAVGGRLVRSDLRPRYIGVPLLPIPEKPIRVKTVRNLCARELLAWDGGAFDPEKAAVITERGLFVLKHGPLPETEG